MKTIIKPLRVCVILPAYNEASVIDDTIRSVIEIFSTSPYSTEIVIVNDASTDDTSNVARQHNVTVIDHILNSGVGSATATGLSYAKQNRFDIAATMDSDGQHLAKDVLRGVDKIVVQKSDLLIGSRLVDSKGMSKVKIIGNKGLSLITYILFGVNSTDSQSGLRIFSRRALEQLRWETSGYEFCSEMLWLARKIHLNISEYPIKAVYTEYSMSKGQSNWNAVNIIKTLIKRRISELLG